MKHPLEFVPSNLQKPFFLGFLVVTLAIFGSFRFLDLPLQTSAAPSGIVSYELAGSPENARSILSSWDENARVFAAFGLGFDYLFMPAYALALSFGLLLAGSAKPTWLQSLTVWMGWGVLAAALFDVVENFALWKILTGSVESSFPQIAATCATIKFILLILGKAIAIMGAFIKKAVPPR